MATTKQTTHFTLITFPDPGQAPTSANLTLTLTVWLITAFLTLTLTTSCQRRLPSEEILRIGLPASIASLDPADATSLHQMWVIAQIFEPLIASNEQGQVEPRLAERWQVDSTGTRYVFFLRQGVYFHRDACFAQSRDSTRMLTAYDVAYTVQRLLDTSTIRPARWLFWNRLDPDTPFRILDSFTIEFRLRQPFAPFLALLATPQAGIVPHEAIEYYGKDFAWHPVGTGPYRVVRATQDEIFLTRNPEYWLKTNPAPVQYVTFRVIRERQIELHALMKGELDLTSGPPPEVITAILTPSGTVRPTYSATLTVQRFPYLNVEFIGFLLDSSLVPEEYRFVLDRRFRQAVNLVIDRHRLLEGFRYGLGIPGSHGYVHPHMYALMQMRPPKGYDYDPERARQLLHEMGITNPGTLPPLPIYTTPEYKGYCEFVAHAIEEELGIRTRLEVVDPATLSAYKKGGRALLFRASWIADYLDPESFFAPFIVQTTPPNSTRYHSALLDSLYHQALAMPNPSTRYQLYRQMDSLLLLDAPGIILYYDEGLRLFRKEVQGIPSHPLNWLDLRKAAKQPQQS